MLLINRNQLQCKGFEKRGLPYIYIENAPSLQFIQEIARLAVQEVWLQDDHSNNIGIFSLLYLVGIYSIGYLPSYKLTKVFSFVKNVNVHQI